ncbi:MAG: hypothetical protein MUP22_13180, partial [Desulfobacterales bacterium]|nr:hypothetical protein [Desulfobacterales bacterium]
MSRLLDHYNDHVLNAYKVFFKNIEKKEVGARIDINNFQNLVFSLHSIEEYLFDEYKNDEILGGVNKVKELKCKLDEICSSFKIIR